MPRPNKATKRQRVNAAAAYRKGDKKTAYKLWQEAAKATKERRDKKMNKNKPEEGEKAATG